VRIDDRHRVLEGSIVVGHRQQVSTGVFPLVQERRPRGIELSRIRADVGAERFEGPGPRFPVPRTVDRGIGRQRHQHADHDDELYGQGLRSLRRGPEAG